jgi:hypothetical protein
MLSTESIINRQYGDQLRGLTSRSDNLVGHKQTNNKNQIQKHDIIEESSEDLDDEVD